MWGRDKGLVGQTGCSGRVTLGLGAFDSVCTHSPLCAMLREKENQLLVMVSTAMPGCGISSLLGLCLVCQWLVEMPGGACWVPASGVGCPAALSVPPATPLCSAGSALCRRTMRALSAQQILTSASQTMVL